MAGTARICSICNWVDPKARPQSTLYSTTKTPGRSGERASASVSCPTCGNRVDAGITQCPYCGNLVGSDYGQYGAAEPASSYNPPPEPAQRESVVVFQQSIGTHDKKRTYSCPRCGSRIDNPKSGHCPNCGYVGSMQYDILQRQPQWATPPQNNTPPSRYSSPPSQDYSSSSATVTSIPTSPRGRQQAAQPPAYMPPQTGSTRPEMPVESSCPKCGAPNPGESRFCGNCGYRYGVGKLSQKISTMSIEDRSYAAAGAGNVMTAPIYDAASAGEEAYEMEEMPARKGRKPAKGRGEARIRTRERPAERKFPMGLMMSVMVVAALIIALAIYVISGGPTSTSNNQPAAIAPVLSGVTFTTNADGSIQVRWTTDKPSTSQVMFCDPAGLCSWTDKDYSYVKEHSVTMSSVKANVLYHVTVESVDQEGVTGQFESEQTFTGLKTGSGDTKPPKISAVSAVDVTDVGFVIKWTTDEPATSQVEYGTTKSYGSHTEIDPKLRTSHSVTLYGVSPNTSYYVRVVAADSDGNTIKDESLSPVLTQNAVAEGVQVGNRALDFEINDLSGNLVKLSSYRGKKIVILNFWATWCTPCMDELPLFQQVKTSWVNADRLEVLAVDNVKNDTLSTVQTAVSNGGYTFRVLLDSAGQVSQKYVIGNTIPITYFIDSQGIIRSIKTTNFVNLSEIESILNQLN